MVNPPSSKSSSVVTFTVKPLTPVSSFVVTNVSLLGESGLPSLLLITVISVISGLLLSIVNALPCNAFTFCTLTPLSSLPTNSKLEGSYVPSSLIVPLYSLVLSTLPKIICLLSSSFNDKPSSFKASFNVTETVTSPFVNLLLLFMEELITYGACVIVNSFSSALVVGM